MNLVKKRILPILGVIIAYFLTYFKKSSTKKFHFSSTSGEKKNAAKYFRIYETNCKNVHASKNQLGKIKCFSKISAYLCSQFKQKSRLSKNQWKTCEANIYLHNQTWKKAGVLPIFGEANIYLHNQSRKKTWVLPILGDIIV